MFGDVGLRLGRHLVVCAGWLFGGCVASVSVGGLEQRAFALRTIDLRDSDFSDLDAFDRFVGDARVVLLGEHHHDGRSFHAMSRLVRFLHERKGFDVLAFESGLADMDVVDRALALGSPVAEAVELGVASPWSQSQEARPLFEYVSATKRSSRPVQLVGFDIVRTALREETAAEQWELALFGALDRLHVSLDGMERACLRRSIESKAHTRELCSVPIVERIEAELRTSGTGTEVERGYANQLLRSIAAERRTEAERADAPDYRVDMDAYVRFMNEVGPRCVRIREAAMGENLRWLVEGRFRNKKVIVWAAEGHTNRASIGDGIPSAASYVVARMGQAVRSTTFVWHSGAVGIYGKSEAVIPEPASLEANLHRAQLRFAFVDLRDLKEPLPAFVQDWRGNQDGLFFIDEMTPNTLAPDGTWAREAAAGGVR